jgi:hypothetical protein
MLRLLSRPLVQHEDGRVEGVPIAIHGAHTGRGTRECDSIHIAHEITQVTATGDKGFLPYFRINIAE